MNQFRQPILMTCLAVWCIHSTVLLLMRYYQPTPTILPKNLPTELIEIISLPSQPVNSVPTAPEMPADQSKFNPLDLPSFKPANINPTIGDELEQQAGSAADSDPSGQDQEESEKDTIESSNQTANAPQLDTFTTVVGDTAAPGFISDLSSHPGTGAVGDIILAQRRKNKAPKATFKFTPINQYASASSDGISIYSHQGTSNRLPQPTDFIYLDYQERARKHFHQSFNAYADLSRLIIPETITLVLQFRLSKNGEVSNVTIANNDNPTINKFIQKMLEYAGKFPPIPKKLNLDYYPFNININLAKGPIIGQYHWF